MIISLSIHYTIIYLRFVLPRKDTIKNIKKTKAKGRLNLNTNKSLIFYFY